MKITQRLYLSVLLLFLSPSAYSIDFTCYSTVYAPYSFLEKGQPTGIDIDLINKIAEKIEINVSFDIIPWARLKQLMLAGKVDCAAAFLKSSENAAIMAYMKSPITTGDYTLFIEKKNRSQLKKISDYYGGTIAVVRGFNIPLVLQEAINNKKIRIYQVDSVIQSLQMLSTSRVQAALIDKRVGNYYIKEQGIGNISPMEISLISTPVYLVFSKKWKKNGIVDKFDIALQELIEDGTYQQVLEKY